VPAYPTALPIAFPFEESAPDYQVIRTEMEMGYVQTRAKTTVAPRLYKFQHVSLTAAEVATWLTFWNARKGGGETFDFTDPRTALTVTCRFLRAQSTMNRTNPQTYDIDVELEEAL